MSITAFTTRRPVSKSLKEKIKVIVKHVIEKLDPEEIYLIGSMQRGFSHANSDIDLVTVVAGNCKREEIALKVLPSRPYMEIPLDLHVFDSHQFDKMKNIGGLCFEAVNHGELLFSKRAL